MDHVQVRFPTNVEDVGRVIYDLTRMFNFNLLRPHDHY